MQDDDYYLKKMDFQYLLLCTLCLSSLLCKEAEKINSEIFCNKSYIKMHKKMS